MRLAVVIAAYPMPAWGGRGAVVGAAAGLAGAAAVMSDMSRRMERLTSGAVNSMESLPTRKPSGRRARFSSSWRYRRSFVCSAILIVYYHTKIYILCRYRTN